VLPAFVRLRQEAAYGSPRSPARPISGSDLFSNSEDLVGVLDEI